MKKNKEELSRIHKIKCRELKEIRAKIAADLGIELHQRECTYEGYCRGTCPACRQEEMRLNAALLKRQMEEGNLKGRVATAGLAAAASLCLAGCQSAGQNATEGTPENLNNGLQGFITPETSDGYITPLDETSDFPEDNLQMPEYPLGGDLEEEILPGEFLENEILPEDTEIFLQPSWEATETYTELEGDVAYLPESGQAEY